MCVWGRIRGRPQAPMGFSLRVDAGDKALALIHRSSWKQRGSRKIASRRPRPTNTKDHSFGRCIGRLCSPIVPPHSIATGTERATRTTTTKGGAHGHGNDPEGVGSRGRGAPYHAGLDARGAGTLRLQLQPPHPQLHLRRRPPPRRVRPPRRRLARQQEPASEVDRHRLRGDRHLSRASRALRAPSMRGSDEGQQASLLRPGVRSGSGALMGVGPGLCGVWTSENPPSRYFSG
jgi:hypothetical protein